MTIDRTSIAGRLEANTLSQEALAGVVGGNWWGNRCRFPSAGQGSYGQGSYGQPGLYTVQRGDNLTNIARQSGHSLNDILTWNPQYQSNPNLIHPGEQVFTGGLPSFG